MIFMKNLKQKINAWLDSLAKENEKQFGTSKPDCCNLNKKT